jgi:D-3-phosphoglycerate dehydrogenase / 2-oxoglutarate reductase
VPKQVLVAADVDPAFVERITTDSRFAVTIQIARTEAELIKVVPDAEVLVTRHYNRVTDRVIAAANALKVVAQGTSGVDNIDLSALQRRGIPVISLPGENANAVAELVIGQMIALTRTVGTYDAEMRKSVWSRDDCATRHELGHHRLGIVGLGRAGGRVADLARTFGVPIRAFDPYITPADFERRGAQRAGSLADLLRSSDIVTLHVPLTDETRNMIGQDQLALLPPGAILINMCRGEVLDLPAALAALDGGRLAGMALDVYDPEPPNIGWPDNPRLILTPHIAGCTWEAKNAIGTRLYEKICEFYGYERLPASGMDRAKSS